jgi:hypothetical protein
VGHDSGQRVGVGYRGHARLRRCAVKSSVIRTNSASSSQPLNLLLAALSILTR